MYSEFNTYQKNDVLKKAFKGTTTVGLVARDFVVLAADRRATSGYFIASKRAKKILEIDDHVAVTIAGAVGDAQQLVDRLRAEAKIYKVINNEPMPVKSIATLSSLILFQYRPILVVQMLVGGVDKSGPSIYTVDWLGTVTREKYVATGSGTPFAIAILETEYSENMDENAAVKLAIKAVRVAIQRDPGSGEGVDAAVVRERGVKFIKGEEVSF